MKNPKVSIIVPVYKVAPYLEKCPLAGEFLFGAGEEVAMNKPKVSIIVPIYNVANYLEQCVRSIMEQTLQEIEILLIDDGSPDNSPAMCDRFAAEDDRIRVLHQKNAGVSVARNNGMKMATADWIMFVDGDDWLEPDALEILWQEIHTNCELVAGSYFMNAPDIEIAMNRSNAEEKYYYSMGEYRDYLVGKSLLAIKYHQKLMPYQLRIDINLMSPCMKLYRKKLIQENNIVFPINIKIYEDRLFNIRVLNQISNLCFVNKTLYHYRKRSGSATTNLDSDLKQTSLDILNEVKQNWHLYQLDGRQRLFFDMYIIELIEGLAKHYSLKAHSISEWIRYAKELKYFSKEDFCKTAIKNVSIWHILKLKNKMSLILIKMHLFALLILLCRMFYMCFPHKNYMISCYP